MILATVDTPSVPEVRSVSEDECISTSGLPGGPHSVPVQYSCCEYSECMQTFILFVHVYTREGLEI